MKIDSHQHFWQYSVEEYDWMEENMSLIQHDFMPDDLVDVQSTIGFEGSIAVQARTSLVENDFLLALAETNDLVKGVVGWVDLLAPDVEAQLEQYADNPYFVGVRHVLQCEDPGFMLGEAFLNGISKLPAFNLKYDILIYAKQLVESFEFASKFPNQAFVIDHIAKPDIKQRQFEDWAENISKMAELENCYCKLSGMVTETDWENWAKSDFYPYIDTVLELFGPQRLMIGSDWPVALLGGDYHSVMSIVIDYIQKLSYDEQKLILGETCESFYLKQ